MRTSSATVSEGSEDGSKRAEQRKSILKEIPEIAVDPSRALSHYLLWADKVKNVLLRTRPAEMWARAVAANLTGPAAAVAWRAISENVLGGRAVKCSLLTGIYGVGSWEGVVEQEWDDMKLGHREDPRALKERLDQLAVVLAKSQVDVKKTFGKQVLEEMKARLKAGIPGNKIMRGDFEWERALEIVQEVFVDSLCQVKQHQDFRGFGQGRGGHGYKRGQGFHRGGLPRFHQQAPHSAACHRCGRDDHWARNCILNLQHRDFWHMWRCNICGNKGHGPVRCPFRNSCQQQQNQQQQSPTQQQHQEQPNRCGMCWFGPSILVPLFQPFGYPVLAKVKQKVAERLKEWHKNGWSNQAAFHQFLLDARSSELSTFTSLCDSSRQQMTRMWFGKEGASDHCQMIVERVMGLREDGTEDWDLFVDNLYMFFTGSDIRKFVESVVRLIWKFTKAGLKV